MFLRIGIFLVYLTGTMLFLLACGWVIYGSAI